MLFYSKKNKNFTKNREKFTSGKQVSLFTNNKRPVLSKYKIAAEIQKK